MGTSENTEMCSCKIAEEMRTSLVLFMVITTALAGNHYLIETGDTETKIAEGGNEGGVGDYGGRGGGRINWVPGRAHCACVCNDYVDPWGIPIPMNNSVCDACVCN